MRDCKYALEIMKQELDNKHISPEIKYAFLASIEALEKQLNNGWIPFISEYDDDCKMEMLQGEIPEGDDEILVTDGESVWSDTFIRDGIECYLDSGRDLIDTVTAWQPLPEPYQPE